MGCYAGATHPTVAWLLTHRGFLQSHFRGGWSGVVMTTAAAMEGTTMGSGETLRLRSKGLLPPVEPPSRIHFEKVSLTDVEDAAFHRLERIAEEGRCATLREICEVTGLNYQTGAVPALLTRLVQKGFIEHVAGAPLHRGIWIRICGTNLVTAEPARWVVHWQFNKQRVPTPAIHQMRQRDMTIAQWIEQEARAKGEPLADFLQELVLRGVQDYRADLEA